MLQFVIFFAIVAVVLGPLHWYLYRRLVKDTTRPGRARRFGAAATAVLAALLLAAIMAPRVIGTNESYAVTLAGYLWLAMLFYLVVVLLVLELPMRIARLVIKVRASPSLMLEPVLVHAGGDCAPLSTAAAQSSQPDLPQPVSSQPDLPQPVSSQPDFPQAGLPLPGSRQAREAALSRRLLLSRGAAIFAGLTAVGLVGYGMTTALGDPVLKRLQVPLPKLPFSMDGYRVAVVSDIHLGPMTDVERTERIVHMINSVNPDAIAIVGDLVDGSVAELGVQAAPLSRLRSQDGAFFVTGNHEYFSGADEWLAELERLGIRTLRNERVRVRDIDLAGVNDVTGSAFGGDGPDFAKALGDRDPGRAVVLLAHQPIQAFEAAKYGVDLQISGHTHGGQLAPFNHVVALQQPVVSGLGEVDGVPVYVSNGAGFWGPPVRVGASPDITLLQLRRRR